MNFSFFIYKFGVLMGVRRRDAAHKAGRTVLPQNDPRQVAAEKQAQPLGDGVSPGILKDKQVAGGKAVQRHTAHQYIVGGTQAAAEGPIQRLPCLGGKVTQVRALHAHDLAQVVQVVHAAVHNAVVLAVVGPYSPWQ